MLRKISIYFTIFFLGCKPSLENQLVTDIEKQCGTNSKNNCNILLRDQTKFVWDKLYIFGAWTMPDSISSVIKFDFTGELVPDDCDRMLFTYNHKIVYQEDIKHLDSFSSSISFPGVLDSLLKSKIPYFTPKTAIFTVEREAKNKDYFNFYLKPVR